jgi:ATP-dependent Lon protease
VVAVERVEAPAPPEASAPALRACPDVLGSAAVGGGVVALVAVATGAAPGAGESVLGTLCRLVDRSCEPDGLERIVLEGLCRVRIGDVRGERARRSAVALPLAEENVPIAAPESEHARIVAALRDLADQDARYPADVAQGLRSFRADAGALADRAATRLLLPGPEAERVLREVDALRRLALVSDLAESLANAPLPPRSAVGTADPVQEEALEFERLIERSACSAAARARALRELAHFRRAAPGSGEAGRIRGWLEWMLELPWNPPEPSPLPLEERFERLATILDETHAGLDDVKQRLIEFLAVRELHDETRGTVLCFVGPTGTGKTSMAHAVAQALGRPFAVVPLGGAIEDADLRGDHSNQRGAVPGLVLQAVARAGTMHPVVLLEGLDRYFVENDGGSGSGLGELLDRELNREFLDHYLGVPYDLSRCIFLATAHDLGELPETMLDRLEVLRFESLSEAEKLRIAREHLIPRVRARAGLTRYQLRLSPSALKHIVRGWTEEAGVRQLQQRLEALARKAAVSVVRGGHGLYVRKSQVSELLGPSFADEDLLHKRPRIGVTQGLAWTNAGGATLPIEALAMPGSGRTILTGSIGDVMRESVQTAISHVRTLFGELDIAPDRLETLDLHLHFPSGATPKDGPSAGIAIATSIVSLLAQVPVRHDVCMTGEMSLHGAVLPVGGLRDKLLAAARAGLREVIVPARNSEEVMRLPAEVRRDLVLHPVEHVREVFALALALRPRSRLAGILGATPNRGRASRRRASGPPRPPRRA